jgi:hypothetical protein
MKGRNALLRIVILPGLLLALHVHRAGAENSLAPDLAPYASISNWCGRATISQNVTEVPWIGCFILSAGHSATRTFSNHRVGVAVDMAGQDVFTVDGTVVTTSTAPKRLPSETNLPFIHETGAGYVFCEDGAGRSCPFEITIFERNPDRSVLFVVDECLPPGYSVCVSTQENWDYETARRH